MRTNTNRSTSASTTSALVALGAALAAGLTASACVQDVVVGVEAGSSGATTAAASSGGGGDATTSAGGAGGAGGAGAVTGTGGGDAVTSSASSAASSSGAGGGNPLCEVSTFGGHTYSICNQPLDWFDASAACAEAGSHLLVLNDAVEEAWMYGKIEGAVPFGIYVWMGMNDLAMMGTYVWADGEPVTYVNFHPGEPNGVVPNCVLLNRFAPEFGWNDGDCTDLLSYYICETS